MTVGASNEAGRGGSTLNANGRGLVPSKPVYIKDWLAPCGYRPGDCCAMGLGCRSCGDNPEAKCVSS